MKSFERDAAYLWDMLDATKNAIELSTGIELDELSNDLRNRYAIERALEIIGEAARRVSPETTEAHPDIPWKGIIGLRNVLAHEYGVIDYQRLLAVVRDDLPELILSLEAIIAPIDGEQ